MNYHVGGANASGKSTVLRALSKIAPEVAIIHGTTLLMDELGVPRDYEAIRAISQEKLRVEYGNAATRIISTHSEHPRIFDYHYLTLRRGKVESVTADWLDRFAGLVLIYTNLDKSWERVVADHPTRDRALFPAGLTETMQRQMLADYIEATKHEFERVAKKYNRPHLIIDNSDKTPEQSARQLLGFIEQTR